MTQTTKRESPFKFRLATEEDLPLLHEFCKMVEAEWDHVAFPYNESKVDFMMRLCVDTQGAQIYENNGVPVGVICMVQSDLFWWSDKKGLTDVIMYIKPEFRSAKRFDQMLHVCEEYAKINKVPLVFSFWTDKDTKRKLKLFKRKGYTVQGFSVYKDFSISNP